MTKRTEQIVRDARNKGLRITQDGKTMQISTGKTNRSVGIIIWDDNTITRSDIPCNRQTALTQKAARKLLQI